AIPIACLALLIALNSARTDAQGDQWGAIKGRIVWGGEKIPPREEIDVAKEPACLQGNPTADPVKNTILDEKILIDPKTKGLKNVFVYILVEDGKKIAIHPKLQNFPKELVVDQPCCMFWPRALAIREGQVFVVKNSSSIKHNIRWSPDAKSGGTGGSIVIDGEDQIEIKDLKAQRLPMPLECNIHPWMKGNLAVFNHPYFAITDETGNFEIKDAPAGAHKLMIWHEEYGYRLLAKGNKGEDVTVKAGGVTDLKDLPMGK
ncbi:MAG TPA: hypothetical protein VE988_01145, partial [Gemmataceae bacterium]|nr:hypothetical protein [Gemmataceae bacterium]